MDEDVQLLGIGSEGFFTQDILSRFKAQHTVLIVMAMRRRYIDNINFRVLSELFVGAVGSGGARGPDSVEESTRSRWRARCRGRDDDMFNIVEASCFGAEEDITTKCLCNAARRQYAPLELEF